MYQRGDIIRDVYGQYHTVLWQRGNVIKTYGGDYIHVSKVVYQKR